MFIVAVSYFVALGISAGIFLAVHRIMRRREIARAQRVMGEYMQWLAVEHRVTF